MYRFRMILVFSLVVAIACSATGFAVAQRDAAVKSTGKQATRAGSQNLLAIIGQVARPGVYQAQVDEPYLVDLVHNAGGFSAQANGYLRIIRQGPDGIEAIYANGRDFQLRRGDVVVAVRKTKPEIRPHPVRQSSTAIQSSTAMKGGARHQPPTTHVQLAFVNLTDRPIVLKMRRENATVGRILELLGHSPNLAQTVRVIAPGETANFTPASRQLVSESVLVFDPAVIRQDRLPKLPTEIVSDTHEQREAIAAGYSGTALENPDATQQSSRSATVGDLPTADVPPPIDIDSPKQLEDADLQLAQNELSIPPVGTAELPAPIRIRELSPESLLLDDPLAPPDVSEIEAGGSGWPSVLMYSLLTISICSASAWGVWRLVRRRMQSLRTALLAKSVDREPSDDLNDMIYDQLPVVEESLVQSDQRSVFSQPAASKKHTRIDSVHTPPRPHFLPETAIPNTVDTKEEQPTQKSVGSAEVETISGGKQFRVDGKHDRDTVRKPVTAPQYAIEKEPQGLLDRVLSRVQGAAKR